MPTLLHIVDKKVSQEYRFDRYPILIGRLPGSQIVLKDGQVSRRHARIFQEEDTIFVEDLNSTNFVYVNGKRVLRGKLAHGDAINVAGIADFVFLTRRDAELAQQVAQKLPLALDSNLSGEDAELPPDVDEPAPPPPPPKPPPADATQAIRVPLRPPPAEPDVKIPPSPAPPAAPTLEDLWRLAEVAAKLLGGPQAVEDGLVEAVDKALKVTRGQRGLLLVRNTRIGFGDSWQVKIARDASGADLDEDEKNLYAKELVERAAAVDETTTSIQLALDTSLWGAKSLPRSMREVICTPLKASDWVLGVLYADGCKADTSFGHREQALFEHFARWAAAGLDKQRLAGQLGEQHQRFLKTAEELKAVTRKLRAAEERLESQEPAEEPGVTSPQPLPLPEEPEPPPARPADPYLPDLIDPADFQQDSGEYSDPDISAPDLPVRGARPMKVPPRLAALAKEASTATRVPGPVRPAAPKGPPVPEIPGLVASSPEMAALFERAREAAAQLDTILISGEPGVGKKTLARAIHSMSDRAKRPFIHFPGSAYSEAEAERKLFGYVEMSGRAAMQTGMIDRAKGGVLLIEDVDRLAHDAQERLDHFLMQGSFIRVDSDEEQPADVKVIATTTRNLKEDVAEGSFVHELYYFRLGLVELRIPPLTERPEDVAELAQLWLAQANKRYKKQIRAIAEDVLLVLRRYPWRNNLTEMKAALESAISAGTHRDLELRDLPSALQEFFRKNQAAIKRKR